MRLSGEYVVLRPLEVEDAALTLQWRLGDRAALVNAGAGTPEEQRSWIAARPSNELNFIIELRSGIPVGMLSLISIDLQNRRAEPARFLIGEPDAVKGIPAAIEAMKLLYELAFDELGLRRVHGTVAFENQLMIKWQKFLGMREEGTLREHYFVGGHFQDAVCLGMMEDEYRAVALPRMRGLIGRADHHHEQPSKENG